MNGSSEISNFYVGRNVFITGVSGFLGKAILEKLLRSCSHIGTINILLRPKYGIDIQTRLNSILQNPIFDRLRCEDPGSLKKLKIISGDICSQELGLSEMDRRHLTDTVSIVIHSAASVKFNEPLKQAMNINYYGTQRVLDLAHQMKNLAAFVHISTAYANCDLNHIKEEIIIPEGNPEMISWMSPEMASHFTPIILKDKPNTYTYTKSLAEALLMEYQSHFPIACIRPSIIGATWQEPQPGFVDGVGGLTGVMAATGKGLLVALNCNGNNVSDIIPLDVVANLIIASAWDSHLTISSKKEIAVYNCCSGSLNPLTMNAIREHGLAAFDEVPPDNVFRYPGLWFTQSYSLFILINALFSFIPCLLMDILSFTTGGKIRMMNIYKKMMSSMCAYAYFHMREWKFDSKNMQALRYRLSPQDQRTFYWNIEDMSHKEYIFNYNIGVKKWIFKEDISNLMSSRVHFDRIYWATILTRTLFMIGIVASCLKIVF